MHHFTQILRTSLSFVAAATLIACGGHDDPDHEPDDAGDGAHAHTAPHAEQGGVLIDLEEHVANVEFLLDAETGTLTMYTLGGHAEKSLRSPTESVVITIDAHGDSTFDVTLAAQANALSKETVGDSSNFVGQSDSLKGVDDFHGTIQALTLKDSDYLNFKFDFPGEHDEADHDEDREEHDGEGEDHDSLDHDHDDDSEHENG